MSSPAASVATTRQGQDDLQRVVVLLQRYLCEVSEVTAAAVGWGATANLDVEVLLAIRADRRLSPSELGSTLGVPRSTLARSLARLLDGGFVERRTNATDRRRAELVLTRAGRTTADRLSRRLEACYHDNEPLAVEIVALRGRRRGDARPAPGSPSASAASTASRASALEVAALLARVRDAPRFELEEVGWPLGLVEQSDRHAVLSIALEPTTPTRLATELHLSPTGVSSLLDRLVAHGLVERVRDTDESDRRTVLVRATPQGRRAADRMVEVVAHHLDDAADVLALTIGRA